ncbi:hypothetical protein AUC43_17315 [Hymenobacter sedentarius]|uniref:Lipocalin-like domain-containing protein n=1 Tax=Hymenobacter sedentarius TaxID=1411621 RepID=A0A0U4B0W2_9BACT|nr:hypothetical protein AUC43_17315 [Hymenobacter sedentarius]
MGQSRTTKTKAPLHTIVGTWRLLEFTDLDANSGKWVFRYGKHPKGYFTYTKSGVVNLNISRENPPKISEDSAKKTAVNLFDFTNTNAVGYFGTYTVDVKKSIVTHHITGGSLPWYLDTDQERPFRLKGDTLIIGNHKSWRRVLVRAD